MVALIQSENHAANKGETAGRYQFNPQPTGIGLRSVFLHTLYINKIKPRLFYSAVSKIRNVI